MIVTFMGGTGVEQADGGSIGVFDPQSNKVLKIIEARKSIPATVDLTMRFNVLPFYFNNQFFFFRNR